LIVVLVFATLAAAWSWIGSYAGTLSFGQAVFFGIGAYAAAGSNFRGGSPWYGALGGALIAVAGAVVCAALCLRGRGDTFAFVTLLVGALAEPFVAGNHWLGPHDAYVFPLRPGFYNLQFASKWPYLGLALMVFAVAQALTFGLRSSRMRSVGIVALPPRLAALAASAFVTSVAGSFYAQYTLAVTPHLMFGLPLAFDIALLGAAAGSVSPWSALLAGLIYALAAKAIDLHPAGGAGTAVLIAEGTIIVLLALLRPQGVFALPRRRPPLDVARTAG
jgi:branched-chain amino acid transport system permease protein